MVWFFISMKSRYECANQVCMTLSLTNIQYYISLESKSPLITLFFYRNRGYCRAAGPCGSTASYGEQWRIKPQENHITSRRLVTNYHHRIDTARRAPTVGNPYGRTISVNPSIKKLTVPLVNKTCRHYFLTYIKRRTRWLFL